MNTEYQAKMIVGYFVDDISPEFIGVNTSDEVVEFLEATEDMLYIDQEGIIGFEIGDVLPISLSTADMLQQKATKFKKITGVEAKLCSCLYSY